SFLCPIPHPREVSAGRGDMVIEIFDEDFGEASDFLGQVVVSGRQLLSFHRKGTYRDAEVLKEEAFLETKPAAEVRDQWIVQGVLVYSIEGVDPGDEAVTDIVTGKNERRRNLQRTKFLQLEVRIMEAHGLAKADRFSVSHPYVALYVNGDKQLGRTRAIDLTLDPVWKDPEERIVVPVGLDDTVDCLLTLELWDEDDLNQGDFLGQV
ncbi:unnamed protein product, partial [Choristocarpus tenellus]